MFSRNSLPPVLTTADQKPKAKDQKPKAKDQRSKPSSSMIRFYPCSCVATSSLPARQLTVLDPVRLFCGRAQPVFPVCLVFGIVAFEPYNSAVAFKCEHVRGYSI